MADTALLSFLQNHVDLFRGVHEDRLRELLEGSQTSVYLPAESIVEFGEDARFLGVILEGEAARSIVTDHGRRQILGRLIAGDSFGEIALMTGDKTTYDVIAESRCRVLLVPVTLFSTLIMTEPQAIRRLARTITARFQEQIENPSAAEAAFRRSADPYGLQLHSERPEIILVVNCGSSSLKYRLFDTANEQHNAVGLIERVGSGEMRHTYRTGSREVVRELGDGDHGVAFEAMIRALTDAETGVLQNLSRVSVVGHRIAHGGEQFREAVIIDDDVQQQIESLSPLAPLHTPSIMAGVREARRRFALVPHVAVFDTAFHHTLPPHAYLYGLPYEYAEQKGLRRYGFHGTSHAYVCLRAAQHLGRRFNELEIVSCHLGSGASICAVDHGRSVDTTMGFTPLEGLVMGTRCGDLDPGVVTHLARTEGLGFEEIDQLLNQRSGLLGLSGVSSDMRAVEQAAEQGDYRSLLALKVFAYRIRKYIGAYMAAMGGLDVIIFTGGIGQGSAAIRSLALQGLQCLGVQLEERKNRDARGFDQVCCISAEESAITVLVVPTDEERMIARESLRTVQRSYLDQVLENQRQVPIPIEVSAHHVHLCEQHVEALYGTGHQLTPVSDLSQPGQFACEEQVTLVGPKGTVPRVRVLGPVRRTTQVEIAMTEQYKLGIHPPVRDSGNLEGTPGVTLEGPAGTVTLDKGVICALRHIHMTPEDALRLGLRDRTTVRIRVAGDRELIFGDVRVRVDARYKLAMHIDTDEANAANIRTGMQGYIDGIQEQE